MDIDTSGKRDDNTTHPSTVDSTRAGPSWVTVQLLNSDQAEFESWSLFDDIDDDQADPNLLVGGEPINIDAFIDLCIELGSGDMIDIDANTNILLTINIDS
jgi:hypothetical protein